MELIVVTLVIFGVAIGAYGYLRDRDWWNSAARKLIGNQRPSSVDQPEEVEDESEPPKPQPKHVIVRTWYARVVSDVYPHYKCSCGLTDWHVDEYMARKRSKEHVDNGNNEDNLLRKNSNPYAW